MVRPQPSAMRKRLANVTGFSKKTRHAGAQPGFWLGRGGCSRASQKPEDRGQKTERAGVFSVLCPLSSVLYFSAWAAGGPLVPRAGRAANRAWPALCSFFLARDRTGPMLLTERF